MPLSLTIGRAHARRAAPTATCQCQALARVVVHHQHAEPPPAGQRVRDEVQSDQCWFLPCGTAIAAVSRALAPAATAHAQPLRAVQAEQLRVVQPVSLPGQQDLQAPVAKPKTFIRKRPQPDADLALVGALGHSGTPSAPGRRAGTHAAASSPSPRSPRSGSPPRAGRQELQRRCREIHRRGADVLHRHARCRSTAPSAPTSSRCSRQLSAQATWSSWTTSAATRSRACARPSRRRARSCSTCRPTALT